MYFICYLAKANRWTSQTSLRTAKLVGGLNMICYQPEGPTLVSGVCPANMLPCVTLPVYPLAVKEVRDIQVAIGVLVVVIADIVNEQRDGRVCGDHRADDGAAVLWLCLEGLRSFVHKDAVGGARDECGVDVP